jgi:hypothetical protein
MTGPPEKTGIGNARIRSGYRKSVVYTGDGGHLPHPYPEQDRGDSERAPFS